MFISSCTFHCLRITVYHLIALQCDVDGGFGDWFDVTTCSKSCGGGTKKQSRECDKPTPVGDGKPCRGEVTQTVECNKQAVRILNRVKCDMIFLRIKTYPTCRMIN